MNNNVTPAEAGAQRLAIYYLPFAIRVRFNNDKTLDPRLRGDDCVGMAD